MASPPVGAAAQVAAANWQNRVPSEENIFSMCGLSEPSQVGQLDADAQVPAQDPKLSETNTDPWSMTIVSGTITGRAAARRSRSSMPSSRS